MLWIRAENANVIIISPTQTDFLRFNLITTVIEPYSTCVVSHEFKTMNKLYNRLVSTQL